MPGTAKFENPVTLLTDKTSNNQRLAIAGEDFFSCPFGESKICGLIGKGRVILFVHEHPPQVLLAFSSILKVTIE